MFSTLPPLSHQQQHFPRYAPTISSPLSSSPIQTSPHSPRHASFSSPSFFFPMSSPTPPNKRKESSYAKRTTKKNPLIHRSDDGRETRRKLFLRKVRENSEDRRWEARGGDDEMMRTIWVAEERRRAELQAREAEYAPASQEEEEEIDRYQDEVLPTSNAQNKDEEMVDEVAHMEDAEMEALLAMMETASPKNIPKQHEEMETPYGSDDEEYDQIFVDVMEGKAEVIVRHDNNKDSMVEETQEMMDMS